MDTTKARLYNMLSGRQLHEKTHEAGFDVTTTAAYHQWQAINALCDALDEAFRVKPFEAFEYIEPGVYSRPEYEKHTSPYRHQSDDNLTRAVEDWEKNVAPTLSISARELAKDVD